MHIRNFFIGSILFIILFFSIITPPANMDSPPIYCGFSTSRSYFLPSEISAAKSLFNFKNVTPITDLYYGNIIPYVLGINNYLNISNSNHSIFIIRNYYPINEKWNDNYITGIHTGNKNYTWNGVLMPISTYIIKNNILKKSKVYDNNQVSFYLFS